MIWAFLAISQMSVIFYLSSLPGQELMPLPYNTDKLIHAFIYAILGFFLTGALPERRLLAIIIGMLYGITDEIHQSFVPMRSCSFYDWLADAIGIMLGSYIFILWSRRDDKKEDR